MICIRRGRGAGRKAPMYLSRAFRSKCGSAAGRSRRAMSPPNSESPKHLANAQSGAGRGTAVGRNPISWLIPAHRALPAIGGLGGYSLGIAGQACHAGV